MSTRIGELAQRIQELEDELEVALATRRAELAYTLHGRLVRFEEQALERHRKLKARLSSYVLGARPAIVLTAPLIYLMIVPIALLDFAVTIYQFICFPVCGIDKVRRTDYFVFDRGHLAYLNALERVNCAYCSYANGLFAYVREIAARTEQYWCPIKHARRIRLARTLP
jgi:hypothetical protein